MVKRVGWVMFIEYSRYNLGPGATVFVFNQIYIIPFLLQIYHLHQQIQKVDFQGRGGDNTKKLRVSKRHCKKWKNSSEYDFGRFNWTNDKIMTKIRNENDFRQKRNRSKRKKERNRILHENRLKQKLLWQENRLI